MITTTTLRLGALALGLHLLACGDGEETAPADVDPEAPSGTIETVAGNGIAGDGEDGRPPRETMLYAPADVAFGPEGQLVIVDWNNHRIRALRPDGRLAIVAGEGELADGLGRDDVTNRLNHPTDVAFDPEGRLVIAAWHNSRIKRVGPDGRLEDVCGTGARAFGGDEGPCAAAAFNLPVSLLFEPDGALVLSDQANQRIRRVGRDGVVRTIAGSGERGFGGDGGHALQASFRLPVGQQGHPAGHIARDRDGNLYLADTDNHRVRRIGSDGIVTTIAGDGTMGPGDLEGPATAAHLAFPVDVAVGPGGAVYVADTESNCVRKVDGGLITTVAGQCGACAGNPTDTANPCRCPARDAACLGDGGPAHLARLKRPSGVAFDGAGNLYIADTLNHRIRRVRR